MPRQEKNKLLILKGINRDFSTEEVHEAIIGLNVLDVHITKVSVFNPNIISKQTKATKLLHLTPDSLTSNLTKHRRLLNQVINWEPLRKTKVFQCKNCQRVGHSSANCNLGYRCVKCLTEHKPGECPRRKNDKDTPPGCVNCRNLGHPANYRGCPFLKFAQETTNAQKNSTAESRKSKILSIARLVNLNLTYAHATALQPKPVTPTNYNPRHTSTHLENNPTTPQYLDTQPNLQNLINSIRNDIIQTITTQNQLLNHKINNNSNKIDYILNHLNLKWTN